MDRFLVNPRPKPQPKPKPKPANLMEEVISIKHDESVVENPCLHTVAREWAARLDVSPMAASQMIVAFWQLPARPYKPQPRPQPERVSLAEKALSSDPMQAWFESRDVFACSRKVAQKRKGHRWPKSQDLSFDLLGRTAIQVVRECVRPLREHWRRRVWRVLGVCTHWTQSQPVRFGRPPEVDGKSTPASVDLKLANHPTTAAMNSSITSANNATLVTVAATYALKSVVDQLALDVAARPTAADVDQRVATALLPMASTSDLNAAVALRTTPLDVDTKIANALLQYVQQTAFDAALALRDGRLDAAEALIAALQAAGYQTSGDLTAALLGYVTQSAYNAGQALQDSRLDAADAAILAAGRRALRHQRRPDGPAGQPPIGHRWPARGNRHPRRSHQSR